MMVVLLIINNAVLNSAEILAGRGIRIEKKGIRWTFGEIKQVQQKGRTKEYLAASAQAEDRRHGGRQPRLWCGGGVASMPNRGRCGAWCCWGQQQ